MKRFAMAALAAACFAVSPVQAAQQSSAVPATAAAPSPRALELSRRYIAAMHVDQSMKPMLQSMIGPMLDEQLKANPKITAEQAKALRETVEELVGGEMTDEILERTLPIYATVFSEDELQALVDFYEGPAGQSIVAKMPNMGPAMAQVVREILPEMREKMLKRFCQKVSCEAAPKTSAHS